jgi:hypothetical protein
VKPKIGCALYRVLPQLTQSLTFQNAQADLFFGRGHRGGDEKLGQDGLPGLRTQIRAGRGQRSEQKHLFILIN